MLKPVVNISGSTMTSALPASGASNASKCARFAAASCHTSGCWMSATRSFAFSAIIVLRLKPVCELLQPCDRVIQRLVFLGHAQPEHRELRRILVERRQWNGGDARLGQQSLGELHIRRVRERGVFDELE